MQRMHCGLAAIFACLAFLKAHGWQIGRRRSSSRPPRPQRLPKCPKLNGLEYSPFLGAMKSFQKDAATSMLVHADYCRQHNLPGVRISVGIVGSFDFIVDPDLVDFVFRDKGQEQFPEGIFFKTALDRRGVGLLTGRGVLLSDGPEHTRKRRLIVPSMDTKSLTRFLTIMEDVSLEYVGHLNQTSTLSQGPATVNIGEFMSAIAMKIVGLSLFSTNVVDGAIYQDIGTCLEHVVHVTRRPLSAPQWIPTKRNRRFRKAIQQLNSLVYSFIEEGRRRPELPATNTTDLLSILLAARYDDSEKTKLSDKELRDEVMTLFLAGHETSAITLCWTMWFLSDPEHCHWQDKIYEEYNNVVSSKGGFSPATIEDPEALKYTRAVLCEALRLRTPSYAVDRQVQQSAVGPDNVRLKKGSLLLLSPMAMHFDPEYFPNPDSFVPTRFLSERPAGKDPWDGPFERSVYHPFGSGRKRCIGYRFAQWEMLVIVSTILSRYRVARPAGVHSVGWEPGITLRPDRALELEFHPRC